MPGFLLERRGQHKPAGRDALRGLPATTRCSSLAN
jgi:hypothetical protein